jgi:hypothetical protein
MSMRLLTFQTILVHGPDNYMSRSQRRRLLPAVKWPGSGGVRSVGEEPYDCAS